MSRFESIGVYLPEKEVPTSELVKEMTVPPMFDIERLTGIKTRRWRADDEDSHTLALSAAKQCLENSKYSAEDLDVIIFTSITRFKDGLTFVHEPSISTFLKADLGMRADALNFDITNACAGMFTGVYALNQLILSGAAKTGIVVSGECITPIAETAVKEITQPVDDQFASLTVGDSGAAVIMDESLDEKGLDFIDLVNFEEYSDLCFGMASDQRPGVAMYTKAMELHSAAIQNLPKMISEMMDKHNVAGASFSHVIPHQTSKRAITTALELCEESFDNIPVTCISLDKFGNTSSTSHFVVLDDYLKQGKIKPGDRVLMLVLASGLVMGTASITVGEMGGYA